MSVDPAGADAVFSAYREHGDVRLRNEIVLQHLSLAEHYVRRFTRMGVPPEDLRQVAHLAIVRAVERFDPDRGVAFATFASRSIEGELKRYFRDRTWAVRPPRRIQELHLELRRATEALQQRLGRSPTPRELAEELQVGEDEVLEALEANAAHESATLDTADNTGVAGWHLGDAEIAVGRLDLRMALAALPERHREIVILRFYGDLSQAEIAERIGVSQSYLSRMLRRALLDLRARIDGV